ncbi:hypothetical protein GIB67_039623 [Kingdonia uniflora]|uniref:Uncharacterized protein n=1 Tax=Kingdonia uniflora TaxID=39325 RepID=A0A7J7MDE7_9MAGN|nr:hypothetical protein GIB67_039623 [Kingdonia uniflora]
MGGRRKSEKERLSRLEAACLASNKDAGNDDFSKIVTELQSKLEDTKAEQLSELQKVSVDIQKLSLENAKLQYRITHLVRALKERDCNLEA